MLSTPFYVLPRAKTLLLHFFCWMLLIGYEMGWLYYAVRRTEPPYVYACYYAINIGFFYLLVWVSGRRRPWLSVLFAFVALLWVKGAADYLMDKGATPAIRLQHIRAYAPTNLARGMYFAILAAFYRVASYLSFYRKQAADAKVAYYKQQMQPHLLFNTLNFIYSRVDEHSPEAARCVLLLGELMRFSIAPADRVSIDSEALQLRHLVEINAFRFGQMFLEVNIDAVEGQVIPLVLLTLAENLFKHGDLQDEQNPATLTLEARGDRLFFRTSNRKRQILEHRLSTGLEHIRLRLDHAYGKRYRLDILETADDFSLELSLPL
ncbi:sensor histidine kinase [Mucilaginibacter sp. AW1-3]